MPKEKRVRSAESKNANKIGERNKRERHGALFKQLEDMLPVPQKGKATKEYILSKAVATIQSSDSVIMGHVETIDSLKRDFNALYEQNEQLKATYSHQINQLANIIRALKEENRELKEQKKDDETD